MAEILEERKYFVNLTRRPLYDDFFPFLSFVSYNVLMSIRLKYEIYFYVFYSSSFKNEESF